MFFGGNGDTCRLCVNRFAISGKPSRDAVPILSSSYLALEIKTGAQESGSEVLKNQAIPVRSN